MAETALAGLPRLVRMGEEARWRGGSALGAAVAVAGWWLTAWLVGQPVSPVRTGIAFAAVALPTLGLAVPAARRRVLNSVAEVRPVPRASVYETRAAARERRSKVAAIVLTGVVALLVFDAVTGGGGEMAGLVAGVLTGVGLADLREARLWRRAEASRGTRLFALIGPDALSVQLGPLKVVEDEEPLRRDPVDEIPSPFDLGV